MNGPILGESGSELYRLVADNSDISKPFTFTPKKYTQVKNEICKDVYRKDTGRDAPSDESVFCAQTNTASGFLGDPFVQSLNQNGAYPIYQVGLDAFDRYENPKLYLRISSYIEWIKDTIHEKAKNVVVIPAKQVPQ